MADAGLAIVLHLLTLNIWGIPDLGFQVLAPLKQERVAAICETLRTSSQQAGGWDIVLLQEVWVRKDRETLKNCGYAHAGEAENKNIPLDSGLLILSKYPIEKVERLIYPAPTVFPVVPDGEALARKSTLLVKIEHPEAGGVWVGNTHLVAQYATNDIYQTTRSEQFKMMTRWSLEKAGTDPLILGGDWNFNPESPLWPLVAEKLAGFTESPNAKDFCTVCPPNTMHQTSEGKIDHLFASSHFQVGDGALAFTEPLSINDFQISVSDHFGWQTSVSLAKLK